MPGPRLAKGGVLPHLRVQAAELEEQRDRLLDALVGLYAAAVGPEADDVGSELWTARHRARLALERVGVET